MRQVYASAQLLKHLDLEGRLPEVIYKQYQYEKQLNIKDQYILLMTSKILTILLMTLAGRHTGLHYAPAAPLRICGSAAHP